MLFCFVYYLQIEIFLIIIIFVVLRDKIEQLDLSGKELSKVKKIPVLKFLLSK